MKDVRMKVGVLLSLVMVPLICSSVFAQFGGFQFPSNGIATFRWEGVVDGTTDIYVRGRQVQTQVRSGLPVQRQRYDFSDPLPRTFVQLQLVENQGRGRVRLIQVPRSNNDYTAIVRIEDNNSGQDFYSFELNWEDLNRRDDYGRRRNLESVSWRGRVDGESVIKFRGDESYEEKVSGMGVFGVGFRFSSPLPSQPVNVSLVNTEGRGEIVLIDQPNRDNDYTASVRIRDNPSGPGNYAFTLTWDRPRSRDNDNSPGGRGRDYDNSPGGRGRDYDNSPGGGGRGFRWEGRVDGRDLLFIRGNRLSTDHQSGQPISEENYRFFQPLPFERRSITVRKLDGRGTVRVVQQPSRENGFTAAILIDDTDGGSDRYVIEVEW